MTYVLAALGGLACAALGAFVGALVAGAITALVGVSDFEGARGMVIVWLGGPIGGIAGLIIGLWLVLRSYGGYRGFGAIAARSAGIIVALVVLTAGGIMLRLATDPTLNRNAAKPQLVFEMLADGNDASARASRHRGRAQHRPQHHAGPAAARSRADWRATGPHRSG